MGKLIKGTNDLLTINPELAKELCFDKNRPLLGLIVCLLSKL